MPDTRFADVRWKDDTHTILVVTIKATDDMRKLAQEVLDAQDAVNLCGLAQRFAKVMIELLHNPQNKIGGTWTNQHPVVKLWVAKFTHLARCRRGAVNSGLEACFALAKGQDINWELVPPISDRALWEHFLS